MRARAFSLVEISVIILILGVIVAGISKSSLIYNKYLTITAQNKTKNSPVSAIEGLIMWFETTLEESMDERSMQNYGSLSASEQSNVYNGIGIVTNWYDISKNDGTKQVLVGSTNSNSPKYKTDCINGLPCVDFDGIDDTLTFLDIALQKSLTGSDFTIFIVEKSNTNPDSGVLIGPVASTGHNQSITIANTNNSAIGHSAGSNLTNNYTFSSTPTTDPIIHTISTFSESPLLHDVFQDLYTLLYEKNNESDAQISPEYPSGGGYHDIGNKPNIIEPHSVGSGHFHNGSTQFVRYFSGGIGEIIIYNKTLKSVDRKAVQNYLMEKWRIE